MSVPAPAEISTVVTDREGLGAQSILVVRVPPWRLVLTRAARTWLQTFLAGAGLLVIGSLVVDPADWAKWLTAAYLIDLGQRTLVCLIVATAVAAVSAAQNALELLWRLDETRPGLRG